MKTALRAVCTLLLSALFISPTAAQVDDTESAEASDVFEGLEFRSIGPGFMSGRIADIAIHPDHDATWYVAVGSGGVWRTRNAGTTWTSLFDGQGSYSIGSVAIDPSNPHIIWVGTGEDIGGRHVGYGDGIYRSDDGGDTWENMGLPNSEHISTILVHPENSDVVWVAVEGPLWSSGGDRGLYRTTDGGESWLKTLGDNEWTGVTEVVIDPRNPDVLYAATWQRHRTVAAYLGGGPGSGIHRSTDGGETWEGMTNGLPESNMGKIGLAVSPQKPDIVYAAIELDRNSGGIFRSSDRGSSWEKVSDTVSGATGPHYYQELYASPHQFGKLYLMDANLQISDDGGTTFYRMNETAKHGDNHAIAFRKDDPDYLIVGSDGGLYESFDHTETWKFVENLPVTQYYKVALDDAEPFYNIYGGTQDNSTQGGPSRTDNVHGIQNSDWKIVLDWDGHQPATEPGNPDIIYAERQEGALSRVDITTGEAVHIQPQPGPDEDYERYNWDAPILVSPHLSTRIYFASQRVWRSDNRGDDWTAISGDLTRNQERFDMEYMGSTQSWDNAWDVGAMSNYNTITSLAESPLLEGLLYAGTDDGLIQVTEDGGNEWRQIEAGSLPDLPATAFVNDIKADLHDANTVYAVLDNHKYGDFNPYVYKSTNRGGSWTSITSNLPERTLVWRLVQDHVNPDLMFVGTEFGVYVTLDGGGVWTQMTGGVPTISFRDLAIQRRENDLVGASFGRGFYILDDYSPLRTASDTQLANEATLFGTRDAWWYIPRPHLSFDDKRGSQGSDHYVADNPPFGAVFTYYLRDGFKTATELRQETEKDAQESGNAVKFPGWEALEVERRSADPAIVLTVADESGNIVRRIEGPVSSGFHRVAWDLKYPSFATVSDASASANDSGLLAAPGTYTVAMFKKIDGVLLPLSDPQTFEVNPLREGAIPGASHQDVAAFWRAYEETSRNSAALHSTLSQAMTTIGAMEVALGRATSIRGELDAQVHTLEQDLIALDSDLNGLGAKREPREKTRPTIQGRMLNIQLGIERSTYGPTTQTREQLAIVNTQLEEYTSRMQSISANLRLLGQALIEAGAPWVSGEPIPRN